MSDDDRKPAPTDAWLAGGGEMGALVRSLDWSKTALGAIDSWPPSLKLTAGMLLHSRQPMFLFWGPELVELYNDAFVPSFGAGKHPAALGQRGEETWGEIWPLIYPQIEDVMQRATACWFEDQLVPFWRNDHLEEGYWTYSYSPAFDDSGNVGGTLVVCTETTSRVLAERRLGALRSLAQNTATALTIAEVLAAAAKLFETTTSDIPFALIYSRDSASGALSLSHFVGLNDQQRNAADAACRAHLETSKKQASIDFKKNSSQCAFPGGPWPEPSTAVFIAPIGEREDAQPLIGFVVFGLSPRLTFDDAYREHLLQIADHLSLAVERIETLRSRHRVERAEDERERLLSELEQANRSKDEFFAMLGHELRNPLAPIVTALHLMKERDNGNVRREQEIIDRQVRHLVRLVDDLLDVSRIARGKVTLKKELVDVATVVADAVEMASDLLEQYRHQLSIELPLEGAHVEGDPVRLAQVISNLLTNAARYTEAGGKILLRVTTKPGEIVLTVKDNGIGMDADLLPRVFDLFVQGRRNTDRKEGGLGLGLALVKSFVTMHGGTVVARSEGLGHGSEFEVHLPSTEKAIASDTPDRKAPAASARMKRVLIVDDNIDSAEMMMTMLVSVGHEVAVAHDGPEALAVVEHFSPEVALLDIGLPVMDGYELGKRLHATTQAAGCRLFALTGYGQEHDRAQSKASGFVVHLVKPVDMKNLLQLIAETP